MQEYIEQNPTKSIRWIWRCTWMGSEGGILISIRSRRDNYASYYKNAHCWEFIDIRKSCCWNCSTNWWFMIPEHRSRSLYIFLFIWNIAISPSNSCIQKHRSDISMLVQEPLRPEANKKKTQHCSINNRCNWNNRAGKQIGHLHIERFFKFMRWTFAP